MSQNLSSAAVVIDALRVWLWNSVLYMFGLFLLETDENNLDFDTIRGFEQRCGISFSPLLAKVGV